MQSPYPLGKRYSIMVHHQQPIDHQRSCYLYAHGKSIKLFKGSPQVQDHEFQITRYVNLRKEHEQGNSPSPCNAQNHVQVGHLLQVHHYSM